MSERPSRKRVPNEERKRIAQRAAEIGAIKASVELDRSLPFVYRCCAQFDVAPLQRYGNKRFTILKMLLDGKTNRETAEALNVSRQYVDLIRKEARSAGFNI